MSSECVFDEKSIGNIENLETPTNSSEYIISDCDIKTPIVFEPKINIGIDFGTDGTSIAYSFPGGNQVYIYSKWRVSSDKGTKKTHKARTAILLDKNGNFEAFGINAVRGYASMKNKQNWYFFDNFKMTLYRNNGHNKYKQRIYDQLTAVNGQTMNAEIVFVAAFKHIKEQIFINLSRELKKNNIDVQIKKIQDIQWIMTVPAIWDDVSKHKMLTWIKKAGLVDINIETHCLLKYEPDCASLSLQHELLSKQATKQSQYNWFTLFNKKNENYFMNAKYILIDAGGGTVDIACHQFMNNYSVKELFYPTGGPWGDINIDNEFENILNNILGNDVLQSIKNEDENAYFDLMQNFKRAKINFNGKNKINIILPDDFIDEIDREIGIETFENIVNSYEYKGLKNKFTFIDGYLGIHSLIWKKYLFDPIISKVVKHLKRLLNKKIMRNTKYIYLVGGYSQTPYFQNTITKLFGLKSKYKINVVIPQRPILSVVDGAARMGLLQNDKRVYIESRILAKTYGQRMSKLLNTIKTDEYTYDYINSNTIIDEDGNKWLNDHFEIYARKEDCIPHDSKLTIISRRHNINSTMLALDIYSSDFKEPKTINDGELLCEYTIEWPKNDDSLVVVTEVKFGETMKVVSYSKNNPSKKFKSNIKYCWKESKHINT